MIPQEQIFCKISSSNFYTMWFWCRVSAGYVYSRSTCKKLFVYKTPTWIASYSDMRKRTTHISIVIIDRSFPRTSSVTSFTFEICVFCDPLVHVNNTMFLNETRMSFFHYCLQGKTYFITSVSCTPWGNLGRLYLPQWISWKNGVLHIFFLV